MSEFGHAATVLGNTHIDSWGVGPFALKAGGRWWYFEDSDRFGPQMLRKDGELSRRWPGARSVFWGAHARWVAGGRKVRAVREKSGRKLVKVYVCKRSVGDGR